MADNQEEQATEVQDEVYGSLDEMASDGAGEVEYAIVPGFKPGKDIRIGSVTAGDMIEWSEANEDQKKKRYAGLRLICKSLVGPATSKNGKPPNHRYACDPPQMLEQNIKRMEKMRHKETERVVREILKLNGMTVKQEKEEKND